MNVLIRIIAVAILVGLAPRSMKAQRTDSTNLASFFAVLAQDLTENAVVAVDAHSFSELLTDRLGWSVTPEDVTGSIGQDFRYGPLELFLACEADTPCVLAVPGAHVALGGASAPEPERVTLRLHLTGGKDPALYLRFETLTLQRSAGQWRVVTRRFIGR